MNACKYSVLMSVHEKDDPDYLVTAIEDMRRQEIPPEEYVILVDDPITEQLRLVISEYEKNKNLFTVIWLKDKDALNIAFQVGLKVDENGPAANREKTLLGTLVSDIVRALLNLTAENERINARQKQAEGIASARKKGIKFGRPQVPLPDNFYEVCQQWQEKKLTLKQAAKECNLAVTTFYNKAKAVEMTDIKDKWGKE